LSKASLKIEFEQLTFLTKLGEGGGGQVYKGIWYQNMVAIKRLLKQQQEEDKERYYESFVRELDVLSNLRHPNILQLYGYSSDNEGYKYIITEFMEVWIIYYIVRKKVKGSEHLKKR
jgi:serine/threonine protein kinase